MSRKGQKKEAYIRKPLLYNLVYNDYASAGMIET